MKFNFLYKIFLQIEYLNDTNKSIYKTKTIDVN